MAEDCGEEAAEFVAHYTRRAAGALIHVLLFVTFYVIDFSISLLFCL